MSMSLGPLRLDLSLNTSDLEEIRDMIQGLRSEAQKLAVGGDARVILQMIIGYMDGRTEETSC